MIESTPDYQRYIHNIVSANVFLCDRHMSILNRSLYNNILYQNPAKHIMQHFNKNINISSYNLQN